MKLLFVSGIAFSSLALAHSPTTPDQCEVYARNLAVVAQIRDHGSDGVQIDVDTMLKFHQTKMEECMSEQPDQCVIKDKEDEDMILGAIKTIYAHKEITPESVYMTTKRACLLRSGKATSTEQD
jgi:hypothetical protein